MDLPLLQHHTFLAPEDYQGHTVMRVDLCALPRCISLVSYDDQASLLSSLEQPYLFDIFR